MNREDYLRELDSAGRDLRRSGENLVSAANPINQLRHGLAHEWKWLLPGASVAGFALARFLRRPVLQRTAAKQEAPVTGAAFWVPTIVKILPAALAQLVPLILSLRSARKP